MNQLIQGLFNKKTTVIVAGGALAAISFWIYKSKPFTKKQITKGDSKNENKNTPTTSSTTTTETPRTPTKTDEKELANEVQKLMKKLQDNSSSQHKYSLLNAFRDRVSNEISGKFNQHSSNMASLGNSLAQMITELQKLTADAKQVMTSAKALERKYVDLASNCEKDKLLISQLTLTVRTLDSRFAWICQEIEDLKQQTSNVADRNRQLMHSKIRLEIDPSNPNSKAALQQIESEITDLAKWSNTLETDLRTLEVLKMESNRLLVESQEKCVSKFNDIKVIQDEAQEAAGSIAALEDYDSNYISGELLRLKSMQQRLEGTRKQLATSQKDLERDLLQSIDRLGLSKQEDALDSLVQTEEQRLRQEIHRVGDLNAEFTDPISTSSVQRELQTRQMQLQESLFKLEKRQNDSGKRLEELSKLSSKYFNMAQEVSSINEKLDKNLTQLSTLITTRKVEKMPEHQNPTPTRRGPYRANSQDKIDKLIEEYLNSAPGYYDLLPSNFRRLAEGVYIFGTKQINAKVLPSGLVVRVGGGYLSFKEFVEKYGKVESLKVQQSGDPFGKQNQTLIREGSTLILKSEKRDAFDDNLYSSEMKSSNSKSSYSNNSTSSSSNNNSNNEPVGNGGDSYFTTRSTTPTGKQPISVTPKRASRTGMFEDGLFSSENKSKQAKEKPLDNSQMQSFYASMESPYARSMSKPQTQTQTQTQSPPPAQTTETQQNLTETTQTVEPTKQETQPTPAPAPTQTQQTTTPSKQTGKKGGKKGGDDDGLYGKDMSTRNNKNKKK